MELLEQENNTVVVVGVVVAAAAAVVVADNLAYYSLLAPEAALDASLKVGECHCSLEEVEMMNLLEEDIVVAEETLPEKVVVQMGGFVG